LAPAIDRYTGRLEPGRKTIDLLILSHFDSDHVKGVVQLLRGCHAKLLLLPYVPLHQRLIVAFSRGLAPTSDTMRFFLDPVGYLGSKVDGAIDEIVYVPASTGDGPPDADPVRNEENVAEDDGSLLPTLELKEDDDLTEDERADTRPVPTSKQSLPGARVLEQGSTISVEDLFEFLPYNQPDLLPRESSKFQAEVASYRSVLLDTGNDIRRRQALDDLRMVYDRTFGESSKARNEISLFLLARPLNPKSLLEIHLDGGAAESARTLFEASPPSHRCLRLNREPRTGVLYTGDGCLATVQQLEQLRSYVRIHRLRDLAVLQVMHHGSKYSWHSGVGRRLHPCISVFSSNPDHKGFNHPHKDVYADFALSCRMQVDKVNGLTIRAVLG
jgi:hypothetical protein